MRRSRSAGDKFVFGSRRRTLTPSSRVDEEEQNSESFIGMKSPRPNRAPLSEATNPQLSKDRYYWSSNYQITNWRQQQHPNEFEQKELERFHKWIFESDKNAAMRKDVVSLVKMLFQK
ncbi:hypothetical protein GCK32_020875 [Trichostrongylus colubriformis]|uniref:Uncharacterized protein n=1 Tax=Trichostrongylus colubriformis TaxID=6319 RepID=A0AAN8IRV9_TRICO